MEVATSSPESSLSIRELEAEITELAGHLNAANHRWLVLIAEFDRRQGWSDGFTQSCAHWLSWKCGLDLGAAREKVRVARALETLPQISVAMGRGELSYSKVRAVTRVATPATEDVLLNVALHGTTHHVEMLVRQFRRVQEVEEVSREARQYSQRRLTYFHDEDGSLVVKLQLPAESGALLLKALDAALLDVPLPSDDDYQVRCTFHLKRGRLRISGRRMPMQEFKSQDFRVSGDAPSWSARRADALMVLAESFLQHGAESLSGGDRQQIVVHVDECTLRNAEPGRCELDDGPALPVETARRLAATRASSISPKTSAVNHSTSVARPAASRRHCAARSPHATKAVFFPVAAHKRYVDGHHIQHWAEGGETKLSNLVTLCRFHHRAVHEGGLKVVRCDDGAWRFINKHGQAMFATARRDTRNRWPIGRDCRPSMPSAAS